MSNRPTTGDREQQRADNLASRRQSGLEPLPRDLEEAEREESERKEEPRESPDGERDSAPSSGSGGSIGSGEAGSR